MMPAAEVLYIKKIKIKFSAEEPVWVFCCILAAELEQCGFVILFAKTRQINWHRLQTKPYVLL